MKELLVEPDNSLHWDRLTWNGAWPFPYESFWSVTNKVLQLNHLTWAEFATLIKKSGIEGVPGIIESTNSNWIDFARFADLLRVAPWRLTEGFRDKLGLAAADPHYGIRLCPRCWTEDFYHSVFFDLGVLKKCPIHQCELRAPCKRCTSTLRFSLRNNKKERGAVRYCVACKTLTPSIHALIVSSGPSTGCYDTMRVQGRNFLEWWAQIGVRFPARDLLIADILYAEPGKDNRVQERGRYLPWQRYMAVEIARDLLPSWIAFDRIVPVRYAHWKESLTPDAIRTLRGGFRQDLWSSDVGRCYRSLKKQIFKRYVHPHIHCYRELLNLNWNECQYLDGDELCVPVLAFVVWRMSIEGLVRVQGLRKPRRYGFQLKLMTIEDYSPMSLAGSLRWSYSAFFSIWEQFKSFQGSCNFRIMLSDVQYRENFLYRCEPVSDARDKFSDLDEIHVHLLVPDPCALELHVRQAPCKRGAITVPESRMPDDVVVSSGFANMERCLFQVNHPTKTWTNRAYQQIWV